MSAVQDALAAWLIRTRGEVQVGRVVSFLPPDKARETLPGFRAAVIGQSIECADQVGTMRVLPGDRVRVMELRQDYALVAHSAAQGVVLLTSLLMLEPIAETAHDPKGDATL